MESRYALREIQGAIGYDCRKLEGGRRAVFRHTNLHKIARRFVFERADMITLMSSSIVSAAALSSHYRIEIQKAVDSIIDMRKNAIRVMFPYFKHEEKEEVASDTDYDKYFDALEEMKAEIEAKKKGEEGNGAGESGKNGEHVGSGDGK